MKILLIITALLLMSCSSMQETSISHVHGFAVDPINSKRLLIATHHGLFSWVDESLMKVGTSENDLMGFVVDLNEESTYYSSGHRKTGEHLGFQKTSDGGINWEVISLGENGPVDFHAMTINSKDPKVLYGWYHEALQRSLDGGKTWKVLNSSLSEVITLNSTAPDVKTVYAGTASGLMISIDQGLTWTLLSEDLSQSIVIALAVNSYDTNTMLSFSDRLGLAKSSDGGKTWVPIPSNFTQDYPTFITYAPDDSSLVYLITKDNLLYKSTDGGETWSQLNY